MTDTLPDDVANRASYLNKVEGMPWEKALQQAWDEHPELSASAEQPAGQDNKPTDKLYPEPSNPTEVAERVLKDLYTRGMTYTLRFWRGDWYSWRDTHWRTMPELELKAKVWNHLTRQRVGTDDKSEPWCPTSHKVNDVFMAMKYQVLIPEDSEAPMWIKGADKPDPTKIIGMSNGLLHWPDRTLLNPTPDLFNLYALPYAYDADANCPRWLQFINSTFAHDGKGALAVQEFTGYALSGDNSRQKGLMLIGPPGGGKGVYNRVVNALVGPNNVVPTSQKALAGDFGLWPLIGKPLAVLADARSTGPIGSDALEKLLNIIGGDAVAINRKNASFWRGYLPTRFLWISNDMPRFNDNSGAILRRWIVVRLEKAVAEQDRDPDLTDKLYNELPGILNWALQGLDALNEQGGFTEPDTQAETLEEMKDSASVVSAFLRDCYDVTEREGDIVEMCDVYRTYNSWAEDNGVKPLALIELFNRIKGCPDQVDAKNTTRPPRWQKKTRLVFGIKKTQGLSLVS